MDKAQDVPYITSSTYRLLIFAICFTPVRIVSSNLPRPLVRPQNSYLHVYTHLQEDSELRNLQDVESSDKHKWTFVCSSLHNVIVQKYTSQVKQNLWPQSCSTKFKQASWHKIYTDEKTGLGFPTRTLMCIRF